MVVTGTALLSVLRISGTSSALLRAYVYGDGTDPGLLRQLLTDHQLSGPCLVLRDQVDMPARPFYVYDVATA